MRWIVVSTALLAACGPNPVEDAQESVRAQLNDPASAQFRNVASCARAPEIMTGEVNAKNSFGGYAGFARFFVDRNVVTIADERLMANSEGQKFVAGLQERCGGDGDGN